VSGLSRVDFGRQTGNSARCGSGTGASRFALALGEALRFSRHARERMERSARAPSAEDLRRLEEGVQRVAGKGAREAVVLMPGWAFIVSVPDRTVITAIEEGRMTERVFTGIDAAVWAGSRASSEGARPQENEDAGRLMSA
jgi:flagellar operon protein